MPNSLINPIIKCQFYFPSIYNLMSLDINSNALNKKKNKNKPPFKFKYSLEKYLLLIFLPNRKKKQDNVFSNQTIVSMIFIKLDKLSVPLLIHLNKKEKTFRFFFFYSLNIMFIRFVKLTINLVMKCKISRKYSFNYR